jgi:fumarylacetoacetate (FAA) hydrolase
VRLVTFAIEDGQERVGSVRPDGVIDELEARDMLEWLSGSGGRTTGVAHRPDEVRLLAPVPSPPSVRDFFAYEGHVRAGFQRRGGEIPDAWYEAPVFYFSNPGAVFGPDEAVSRPALCRMLDFELEIAAVVGARAEIAGFTLLNDWSARDIQQREMTVGLGPAKGKDFATSIGPWLVTPDELPFDGERLELEATVSVNGRTVAKASAKPMHFSWPELVAQAARDTRLRAGDVLGSGTLAGGSLLDIGPLDGRWIEPGDEVVLAAPGLGELRTPIAADVVSASSSGRRG